MPFDFFVFPLQFAHLTTYYVSFFQADIDMSKRAGELSEEEVERIITIISNPRQYKIPDYFLNRQKDIKDGKHCLAYNSASMHVNALLMHFERNLSLDEIIY